MTAARAVSGAPPRRPRTEGRPGPPRPPAAATLSAALALLACLAPAAAHADQASSPPDPLTKSEVIRLLARPGLGEAAVSDSIRSRCLSFRPTDRDIEDFRALGASAGVVETIVSCGRAVLQVTRTRVTVRAGDTASVGAAFRRGAAPLVGDHLQLHGTEDLVGGPDGQLIAQTDDAGRVTFRFPVGTRAGTYPLRVAPLGPSGPGAEVTLLVTGGPAASATVEPVDITREEGEATARIGTVVADRFGNRVARIPLVLRLVGTEGEDARATSDGGGRAVFRVPADRLRLAERLEVRQGGRRLASRSVALSDFEGAALAAEEPRPPPAADDLPAEEPADRSEPSPDLALELARRDLSGGRPARATERLEEAVREHPGEGRVWLALARAREAAGRRSGARTAYLRAGTLDPSLQPEVRQGLYRLASLPSWLEVDFLGGATLREDEAGGAGGLRAARLALRPVPSVQLHGRYDRSLDIEQPLLVRGPDDVHSFYGGGRLDWGPDGALSTMVEAGVRDPDGGLVQYVYRASQSVAFDSREGPAVLELGGFVGRWYARDDWVAWGRLEWPVDERLSAVPALYFGETAGPPYGTALSEVARETRGYAGISYRPLPGVDLRPAVGLGSVDRDGQSAGTMVDLVLETSARIAGDFRLRAFLRHQRPPERDPFTVLAGGFSLGFDPPETP